MISFYPGMVLPRPYYVSSETQLDAQSVVDILIDRLTNEGFNGLFDDDYTLPDDEIVTGGNEGRRLMTGGMLNITDISEDVVHLTSVLQIKAGTDVIEGTVNIQFKEDDEVQFCAESAKDLADLWINFCKENNFDVMSINSVEVLGYAYYSVGIKVTECGNVTIKLPVGNYSSEELADLASEEAKKEEMAGNASFYNRDVEITGIWK